MNNPVACWLTSAILLCVCVARAADQLVTNTNDSGVGSLRQSIIDAGSGNTVTFAPVLSGATIILGGAELTIDKSLTIDASALADRITIDANGATTNHRVLGISIGSDVSLRSLNFTGGKTASLTDGGGICNSGGSVTLNNCSVSGNQGSGIVNKGGVNVATITLTDCEVSENVGSGIYNYSGSGTITTIINHSAITRNSPGGGVRVIGGDSYVPVTLNDSTVSDNHCDSFGGGIYNFSAADFHVAAARLVLNRSTVSGNSASFSGGGIYNRGLASSSNATVTLNDSTVSENSAGYRGGGIYNDADSGNVAVTLNHSTVSANSAVTEGGGIYNVDYSAFTATLALGNSIVAGNSSASGSDILNHLGTVTTQGVNLLSNLAGSDLSTGPTVLAAPPILAPLAFYGGPTQTMPPLPGSPAIDSGVGAAESFDQRGQPRVMDGNGDSNTIPDIGAVEIQGGGDTVAIISNAFTTDGDHDGSPFGVERALGTDPALPDCADSANLAFALNISGQTVIEFGIDPLGAFPGTRWIVSRSATLAPSSFLEIYRFDGTADTTMNGTIGVNRTLSKIVVTDKNPPPGKAFYRFQAEFDPE
ncbi:MAG: choice-of-anchor Q domain-containing protein [Luteolibacter sp.]|uniref:choice-of-anchor Q domain-containing protein n=1 Tax=Luteolibacter sp. TaxID=1962973 RepID=UPI0032664104